MTDDLEGLSVDHLAECVPSILPNPDLAAPDHPADPACPLPPDTSLLTYCS